MQRKISIAGWLLFVIGVGFWVSDAQTPLFDIDSVFVGIGAVLLLISGVMKIKGQQNE
ncbi:hypothetical protein MUO14_10550 [Halobacillus shinanisalinarum]|uniref:Uncharacterized protein n=1 Tax=Halobacillus shinanisalinarum TaxID=2932258 RepID=A0ABY4H4D6_9BACI|nr:hypothetical protein [Halobacillus shinanisalinarum]UOQ95322.1 hypothetical protein MUO14_10550 [Halobacillus shinanisalinarum]